MYGRKLPIKSSWRFKEVVTDFLVSHVADNLGGTGQYVLNKFEGGIIDVD